MHSLSRRPFIPKAEPGDYPLFMACCDDTGRLASDEEFDSWVQAMEAHYGMFPDGVYPDEAPYEAEPFDLDLDEADILWWAAEGDRRADALAGEAEALGRLEAGLCC